MKKYFYFIAIILSVSLSHAQKELSKDYSYTVSKPYKVFDAYDKLYFYSDNEIMTVKVDGREIMIQKFSNGDDKVSFVKEKLYETKGMFPGNYQVEDIIEMGDKYYFFYSSWDGGDVENEQLFYREINFKTGEFVGENVLVFKVKGKVTGSPLTTLSIGGLPGINIGVRDKFDFLVSLDKSKMLVQYRKKPEVKSDTKSWDVIGMNIFDNAMKMTSSNEIKMPYTERRMNNLDYAIDREGNAYILAKVFHDDSNDDKKKRKDTEANYHIELFRIKAGTKDIDITKVEVKDKFINGLWLYENPDNYMVCAGFYNKGKKSASTDGIIKFKVAKQGAIYDTSTYEIPLEVLNEYVKNRTKKKNEEKDEEGEAELENLRLRELVINKDDGSLLLIGEKYFSETHYTPKSSYTSYHYQDLLVTKIDAAGKLAWMKKLPKNQRGVQGKGGMSYKHMYSNGFHYLMFLDNVKNFNLPLDKTPAQHSDGKGGYFTSYKIDDLTGANVNSSIFNVRDIEDMTIYQFATSRILKTAEDEFVLEVYKKKKEDVMIKVKMKK